MGFIERFIKNLFKPRLTGRIIKTWECHYWGKSVWWSSPDGGAVRTPPSPHGGEIGGHLTPRPKKGDIIKSYFNYTTKDVGVFVVVKTEYMKDPRDQFFAEVEAVGNYNYKLPKK